MSFKNPTPIQVGTWGTCNGTRYRVAGRLVLGCDVDGERYYWNEFYLRGENGDEATLVHEVGERGVEWRMFVMITPDYPLTATEAASKRAGDRINLEGTDARITLVDESRVYHIEGEAPEGVELGDVANYFNARLDKDIIVVSWTGDEVEYFRGRDISSGLVASAFGLRMNEVTSFEDPFRNVSSLSASSEIAGQRVLQGIMAFLLIAMLVVGLKTCRSPRRAPPVTKINAPVAPLALGYEGTFNGKTWRIRAHTVVEVASVSKCFERHEYHLTDPDDNRALLVCGLNPGDADWIWFTPLEPLEPPSPAQAGGRQVGDTINVDGWIGPVTELFQIVNRQSTSELPDVREGDWNFGFTAQSGMTTVLARWDAKQIQFHRGQKTSATTFQAAFGKK